LSIDQEKYDQLYETVIKEVYSETVLDHGKNPRNLEELIAHNAKKPEKSRGIDSP